MAFGRPWDNPGATHPWVDVDSAAGSALATRHLLERGHTRIAWIGWRKDSRIGEDRRSGWSQAVKEAGHSITVETQGSAGSTLADRGLRSGGSHGEIAVVGFDDSQVAQTVPPGLTSVRQPLEEVAVEVVKALQGLLGATPRVCPGVLLTPSLTLRGSS